MDLRTMIRVTFEPVDLELRSRYSIWKISVQNSYTKESMVYIFRPLKTLAFQPPQDNAQVSWERLEYQVSHTLVPVRSPVARKKLQSMRWIKDIVVCAYLRLDESPNFEGLYNSLVWPM